MQRFAEEVRNLLSEVLQRPASEIEVETPPDPKMGDFGFPCFKLAKDFRKAPPLIAKELAEKAAEKIPAGFSVAPVGPYVNFTIEPAKLLDGVLKDVLDGDGLGNYGQIEHHSKKWVLEFSSLNVAKPFQIYHLRGTALGATLSRVGRYLGYDVVSINHLGDWGTQYGKLSVAFRLFGKELPEDPSIKDLESIYVKFHQEAEKDDRLNDEAREAFKKLEDGDSEMTKLWKKCIEISMKEFDRVYGRIGVSFDHVWGESHYRDFLQPFIDELKDKKLLTKSEGAWVVFLNEDDPPAIIQKKDGATLYATRDIAAAKYRYENFRFDRMTYIVGAEQKLHFEQVFGILKMAGYDWVSKCEHVPTGLYRSASGKMSTRKGNVLSLQEALDAAKQKALQIVKDRAKEDSKLEFTENELDELSEKVAIGAVLFFDQSHDPAKDVVFDLDQIVNFDGETGPYLQYAHTRCLSILRKAKAEGLAPNSYAAETRDLLNHEREIELVKTLGRFPEALTRTLQFSKASQLASYLIDLTHSFGAFYRECQVISDDRNLSQARLALVEATRRILARGLGLLGVPLPERM